MRDEIRESMAKTFFATAWADYQDAIPDGANLSGCEIMNMIPDTYPEDA